MDSWRRSPLFFWIIGLPPVGWLVVFFVLPLSLIWLISFGEKQGIVDVALTWTLDNYARAMESIYLEILLKSIVMAVAITVICLVVAFPVALLISFAPRRVKPWLLLLIVLPFWTNLLIRTYALIAVLRVRGYINFSLEWLWTQANDVLSFAGLGQYQLLGARFEPLELLYNNFAVAFGLVYVFLPFMVLPLYAALERLDRSMIEASLDLGAGQVRTFFSVVVPMAASGIVSGVIITFIPALGSFLQPELLGGTDSQLIANVIERQFKSANDWPFGAALSFILMYLTFFALALRSLLAKGKSAMEAA